MASRVVTLRKAEHLKRAFNERFWMQKEGCFAFGFDSTKETMRENIFLLQISLLQTLELT